MVRGELRGELALLQQAVEYPRLRHGVHGAGRQQVGALLGARARAARPQQRRPEHRRQVVQRHLVLALVLVHPTNYVQIMFCIKCIFQISIKGSFKYIVENTSNVKK